MSGRVDWAQVARLGDEHAAHRDRDALGRPKSSAVRLREYKAAVRANRLLATALQDQGMNEEAMRFAYRALKLQREVLRRQRKFAAYCGSVLLDGLAGYGYKPARSLLIYLVVVTSFAAAYRLIGPAAGQPLTPLDALVFSVTSFHGRGFSPAEHVTLSSPLTVLAAAEAILGLLVEITFIATFTQRVFGNK
jgi:hypothetical protein